MSIGSCWNPRKKWSCREARKMVTSSLGQAPRCQRVSTLSLQLSTGSGRSFGTPSQPIVGLSRESPQPCTHSQITIFRGHWDSRIPRHSQRCVRRQSEVIPERLPCALLFAALRPARPANYSRPTPPKSARFACAGKQSRYGHLDHGSRRLSQGPSAAEVRSDSATRGDRTAAGRIHQWADASGDHRSRADENPFNILSQK
jgi:hypothetical protein